MLVIFAGSIVTRLGGPFMVKSMSGSGGTASCREKPFILDTWG